MLRLLRSLILIALAFMAGAQYERADAATTCAAEAEWSGYFQCVAREILEEVIS